MAQPISSTAFHEAALRSERLRIIAMITATIVLLLIAILRVAIIGDQTLNRPLRAASILVATFIAYELVMLELISRHIRHNRLPGKHVWIANILIETSAPTIMLFILTKSEFMGPYLALSAPVTLLYVVFILFSILRLRPMLCMITGFVSGVGYLLVLLYTCRFYPEIPPGAYPLATYTTFATSMCVAGFAAAFVANQIRKHVGAALREADTRRRIDRIEHDLDIARSIQQDLLPQGRPNLPGFDIAGWSQPAEKTGGDYYDWQQLPDQRLAISLADVTGHGIGPALVTAVCRAYARASFPSGEDLGLLLDRINELLVEDLKQGRFITFVVALACAHSPELRILSAGHGPVLLYSRQSDRVDAIDADDLPFGILSNVGYGPEKSLIQEPGDIFVMITDGFFEWPDKTGEQFGIERLGTALREARDLGAAEIIQSLYRSVREFVGESTQEDDLTAVVIKRLDT